MKELLIDTLSSLGDPVILQGTLAEDAAFPPCLITFFTIGSPEAAAFDNDTALTAWEYQITVYADDPLVVKSKSEEIRAALKAAGFIPQGKGKDIPSGEPTHTGWTCNYIYLENEMGG